MGKNDIDRFLELLDTAREMVEENREFIDGFVGGGDTLLIDETQPLRELQVEDDEVTIITEVSGNFESIGVSQKGSTLTIDVGPEQMSFRCPSDVVTEKMEAQLKNGILTVTAPRNNGTS